MDIAELRENFRTVRRWWRTVDCWSDEDLREVEENISSAAQAADKTQLELWGAFLAVRAEEIRREETQRKQACRALEARAHAAAKQREMRATRCS
jgi:hypothetical protein